MQSASFKALGLGLALSAVTVVADPVVFGLNGHQYEVIAAPQTSWADAAANIQAVYGEGWHLATITSQEEQDFITSLIGPADGNLVEYYIGGLYSNGQWNWVTGEAWGFEYWGVGEPNGLAAEPRVALDGRYRVPNWGWNDYVGDGAWFVAGYVVEGPGAPAAVPEPATVALFGLGIAGLAFGARKRKK